MRYLHYGFKMVGATIHCSTNVDEANINILTQTSKSGITLLSNKNLNSVLMRPVDTYKGFHCLYRVYKRRIGLFNPMNVMGFLPNLGALKMSNSTMGDFTSFNEVSNPPRWLHDTPSFSTYQWHIANLVFRGVKHALWNRLKRAGWKRTPIPTPVVLRLPTYYTSESTCFMY